MRPLSRLYVFWIKSYLQKTVGELRWPQMTFGGSSMKTVACVITEGLSQHHSEWMWMFRCGKEVVEILPIDLTWAGHEIDLTSGHEYKKSKINKLLELLTSSTSKSLKTLGSELWLWQDVKAAKLRFEVTSLTWSGDLTWYDLGYFFFYTRCTKDEWIAMLNLAALRDAIFPLSAKNRWGAHMCLPGRARVNSILYYSLQYKFVCIFNEKEPSKKL